MAPYIPLESREPPLVAPYSKGLCKELLEVAPNIPSENREPLVVALYIPLESREALWLPTFWSSSGRTFCPILNRL